jgi:hypothetical protein
LLLPHQQAEERQAEPTRRLGGRDPLGSMTRMHDEISHPTTLFFGAARWHAERCRLDRRGRELRRLLFALDALIALHLAAEEELPSQVQELPVQ